MNKLLLILGLLVATPTYAMDAYVEEANPSWRTNTKINGVMTLRSPMVLSESRLMFIKEVYNQSKYHFFDFTGLDQDECKHGKLIVNIITEDDLDNRKYFPREDDYSEPDEDLFVLGRYFRHSNTMYIVPPHLNVYYWRKNFCHELIHYFYDDCGVKFANDDIEHRAIEKFMRAKRKWFY